MIGKFYLSLAFLFFHFYTLPTHTEQAHSPLSLLLPFSFAPSFFRQFLCASADADGAAAAALAATYVSWWHCCCCCRFSFLYIFHQNHLWDMTSENIFWSEEQTNTFVSLFEMKCQCWRRRLTRNEWMSRRDGSKVEHFHIFNSHSFDSRTRVEMLMEQGIKKLMGWNSDSISSWLILASFYWRVEIVQKCRNYSENEENHTMLNAQSQSPNLTTFSLCDVWKTWVKLIQNLVNHTHSYQNRPDVRASIAKNEDFFKFKKCPDK